MLIPKKNRKEVYKYLFRGAYPGPSSQKRLSPSRWLRKSAATAPPETRRWPPFPTPFNLAEGVIYAKKDFNLPAHPEIKEVPNLQVSIARRNVAPSNP